MLLAVAAMVAALGAGAMDRTFAHDGTLRSSLGGGEDAEVSDVAPLANGKLAVVVSWRRVVRLRASGRVDRRFGRRGGTSVPFRVDAIAEDPGGGLVIAGAGEGSEIAVMRLRPDGRPDAAFGVATVATNVPVVEVDLALAPDGTAFVVAEALGHFTFAAVGGDGRLVPSFGQGGVAEIASAGEGTRELVRLRDGRLRHLVTERAGRRLRRVVLIGLTADGAPDTTLGPRGTRVVSAPFSTRGLVEWEEVVADSGGRMVFSTILRRRRHDRLVLRAIRPDGERARAFGHRGVARLTLPYRASWTVTAMRSDGAAAVTLSGRRRRHPVVALIGRDGRLVRRFGRRGYARVRGFPRRQRTVIEAAAVDHLDRLVIGGLSGHGLVEIREDFGRELAGLARLRLRRAPLALPAQADVTRAGVMRLPVRCRARGGCRGKIVVKRGGLRRDGEFVVPRGARRTLRLRLGRIGARLAARERTVGLTATVTTAARTEPLAVTVRLRRP